MRVAFSSSTGLRLGLHTVHLQKAFILGHRRAPKVVSRHPPALGSAAAACALESACALGRELVLQQISDFLQQAHWIA
jgi:hypothetical protein